MQVLLLGLVNVRDPRRAKGSAATLLQAVVGRVPADEGAQRLVDLIARLLAFQPAAHVGLLGPHSQRLRGVASPILSTT